MTATDQMKVAVKPLEWRWNWDVEAFQATSLIGTFSVFERREKWYRGFNLMVNDPVYVEGGETEAKAASQADFEARILSALAMPSTQPAAQPVAVPDRWKLVAVPDNLNDLLAAEMDCRKRLNAAQRARAEADEECRLWLDRLNRAKRAAYRMGFTGNIMRDAQGNRVNSLPAVALKGRTDV